MNNSHRHHSLQGTAGLLEVDVYFTAQLQAQLGVDQYRAALPEAATTADLLQHLSSQYGDRFQQFALTPDGELLPFILICVNDHQVARGHAHVLHAGDQVHLVSAISGG